MNWSIYQSFQRIPIGLAVTIEFVGPLTLAVLGSRRPRDLIWVALAAAGVLLLGLEPRRPRPGSASGSRCWPARRGRRTSCSPAQSTRRWRGLDGLAVASVVAALLLTPATLGLHSRPARQRPVLLLGAVVGLLSSVIPYACDAIALRSISPAVFSVLMSLEPAAAALAGLILLSELLTPVQLVAMACVIVASVGATRSGVDPRGRTDAPN